MAKTSQRADRGWGMLIRRTGAFAIDAVAVYLFLLWPFLGLMEKTLPAAEWSQSMTFLSENPKNLFSLNIISLFATFVIVSYFALLQLLTGSTLGMLVLSLRVVPTTTHLHWWQCVIRNLFLVPVFPFIILVGTEIATLVWSKGQGRLLERLSGTKTIVEQAYPSLFEQAKMISYGQTS